MTDEPALLAAIAARPDDDTPRLVYADWLDDHGDADRAEFIRLQCAQAQGGPDDPAAAERADELENHHRIRWLAGVPTGPGLRWEFRRGFPERLEADTQAYLDRYNRTNPWLRDLCLTISSARHIGIIFAHALPTTVCALEVWGIDEADELNDTRWVTTVVTSPKTARLRELRLFGFTPSTATVALMAGSPYLSRLYLLALPGDPGRPLYVPLRARFGDRLVGEGA